MALKRRIIAKFLIENGALVKYRRFTEGRRVAGNPVSTAKIYEDLRLDEMLFCDVGRIDPAMMREITDAVFTPVTAAGGIHTMEHVDALIQGAGVDKVVIKDLPLGEQVARRYGSQAWVFPVDYNGKCVEDVPSAAGEALLTSIDRDGMGKGFDLLALEREWKIPVVLAGGCGRLDHVRQAFDAGADGAAIASMFFFTDKSPIKLRSWLASEGVAVRV